MPTNYPTSLDSFTDPLTTNPMNSPSHAGEHTAANDAILAVETYVGTTTAAGKALTGGTGIIFAAQWCQANSYTLTADNGTTDNTATLTALEAAANTMGGAIIVLPGAGANAFGCNFTTTYSDITWWGAGENEPSGAGGTRLCGTVSGYGTQTNVFDIGTARVSLYNLAIDAGSCNGSSAWSAQTALLNNAADTILYNVSPLGGTLVSFNETSNSKRAKYHFIRPSQGAGSADPTLYVKYGTLSTAVSAPTGTTSGTGNQIIAVSSTTYMAVGCGITGTGIPTNTTITVISGTTVTISNNLNGSGGTGTALTIGLGAAQSTAALTFGIVGNVVGGGFQFTITDGVHSFTTADTGHQISGPGITPGTYIHLVNTSTNATLSQQCATATGITITEYQGDNSWLNGSDSLISNSVFNFGTKRFQGSGQMADIHCTFSGLSGCINTIFEGGCTYHCGVFYTDSSPAPGDNSMSPQLCHTHLTSGPGTATATTALTNWQCFQNTVSNNQPAIVENDTSCSLNITGGIHHAATAQQSTCIIAMTWGTNTAFQLVNFNINTATAVKQTSSYPTTFLTGTSPYSGAAYGNAAGQLSFVQGGVAYGAFSAAYTPPGDTSGTVYQNVSGYPVGISLNFTATSSAATSTLVIGPTSTPATNWGTWTPAITAAVGTLSAIIPPGWYYKFTYTNCTAGTIVGLG